MLALGPFACRAALLGASVSLSIGCQSVRHIRDCQRFVALTNKGLLQVAAAEKGAPPERYEVVKSALEAAALTLSEAELSDKELATRLDLVGKNLTEMANTLARYPDILARRAKLSDQDRDLKKSDKQLAELRKKLHGAAKEHQVHVRRVKALCSAKGK